MKVFRLVFIIFIVAHDNTVGESMIEIYPGSLIKKEVLAIHRNPYVEVKFIGLLKGELALGFKEWDKLIYEEKPVYEKLKVVRERGDINDPGQRLLVPDDYIIGATENREEIIEIGPIVYEHFRYLGVTSRTDSQGILIDTHQKILSQFENLRDRSATIQFSSDSYEKIDFELTRSQLYSKLGIRYDITEKSHPENVKFEGYWDKPSYRPGEIAKLKVTVENAGNSGNVFRLLARSISRWPWLDGKMYYFGDLAAGEEKHLTRVFKIPGNHVTNGLMWLRVGFNEHSGAKPQLPLTIRIHE